MTSSKSKNLFFLFFFNLFLFFTNITPWNISVAHAGILDNTKIGKLSGIIINDLIKGVINGEGTLFDKFLYLSGVAIQVLDNTDPLGLNQENRDEMIDIYLKKTKKSYFETAKENNTPEYQEYEKIVNKREEILNKIDSEKDPDKLQALKNENAKLALNQIVAVKRINESHPKKKKSLSEKVSIKAIEKIGDKSLDLLLNVPGAKTAVNETVKKVVSSNITKPLAEKTILEPKKEDDNPNSPVKDPSSPSSPSSPPAQNNQISRPTSPFESIKNITPTNPNNFKNTVSKESQKPISSSTSEELPSQPDFWPDQRTVPPTAKSPENPITTGSNQVEKPTQPPSSPPQSVEATPSVETYRGTAPSPQVPQGYFGTEEELMGVWEDPETSDGQKIPPKKQNTSPNTEGEPVEPDGEEVNSSSSGEK